MTNNTARWIQIAIVVLQFVTYLWLAWIILFSGYDKRIPVPYIATHIAFGLNILLVAFAVGAKTFFGAPLNLLIWSVCTAAPLVIAEIVILLAR